MKIQPLRDDITEYLTEHSLLQQWQKARALFESDIRHPSLHTELLEPHWRGIYSFRVGLRYRALFFVSDGMAEVFKITKHYRK